MIFAAALLVGLVVFLGATALAQRTQLVTERARVNDLHDRLAARTLAEYSQFSTSAPRPEPEPLPELLWDDTGLIGVEADGPVN